jgi:hypothetical protein
MAVAGTCCDWEANSYRCAENKGDRLPALAADLVDRRLRMEFSERTCLGSLSPLRSAQAEITLGAENIAVKTCDPLPPAGGNVQVLNGGLNMR